MAPSERREPRYRRVAPWAVAGTALAGLAATLGVWAPWRDTPPPAPVRVQVELGTNAVLSAATPSLAMSADGSTLAFAARPLNALSQRGLLFVRRLDRLDAQVLAGTEGAAAPFFSPDGEWIAFFADGSLKKIPAIGGGIVSVCAVASPRGGSWGTDDTIVFASSEGVSRVPAAGGQVDRLTVVQKGGPVPSSPQILPGGRAVLYMEAVSSVDSGNNAVVVVKPLPSGDPKVVLRGGGTMPRYVETGHLTIVRGGTMFAVPFDVNALETRGSPMPVADNINTIATVGAVASLSAKGLLVYQPRVSTSAAQGPIVWLDRSGATTPLRATPALWALPRFSPDGKRLALVIDDGRQTDV
jgi:serine/threonine-protein kinase